MKFNVVMILSDTVGDIDTISTALLEVLEKVTWGHFKKGEKLSEDKLLSFLKENALLHPLVVSVKVVKRIDADGWEDAAKKALIGSSDSWRVVSWESYGNWCFVFKLMLKEETRGLIWVLPSFDYIEDKILGEQNETR